MKFAVAKKIGMTRIFNDDGESLAATVIKTIPTKITKLKNEKSDGYEAVVLSETVNKKSKNNKFVEFRVKSSSDYNVGDEQIAANFENNDNVTVVSKGKGKGFSGVIKRHGFSRGPMSHGSNHHRSTGAIGGAYPQRVVKGKKMPGRLGGNYSTIKNLRIIDVEHDSNTILISGSIPGANKSKIRIYSSENED